MDSTLSSVVSSAVPRLSAITEDAAARKPAPNKWSTKEILGHLVDSAANNHQRFVRLQLEPEIRLPGYEQDGWVRVSRWQHTPWTEIRRVQLGRAQELLVESGLSIARVAKAAGFRDQRHMSVAFRQDLGMTPTTYRRQFVMH